MQFNTTGQAIYLQIVDFVCEKVLLDEYQPEDKLPSVREMGMQLEVNPNTVMRAYEVLKQQGIIHDRRGIGYFISEAAKENALNYRKQEFTNSELPAFSGSCSFWVWSHLIWFLLMRVLKPNM